MSPEEHVRFLLNYYFYFYVLQRCFDDDLSIENIILDIVPATALWPDERELVQNHLRPGYTLLGRIPYEAFTHRDFIVLRAETSTKRRTSSDQRKRRYLTIDNFFNFMKIPADGSTSNMEPKVFQLSDENHGSAVHTMFQNFREVSIRFFACFTIKDKIFLMRSLN